MLKNKLEPFSEFSLKLLGVTDLELPAWFPFIFMGVVFFFGVILLTPVYYQKTDINNPDAIYQQVKKLVLGAKTA